MPTPEKGEKRADYISRCVRMVKQEEPDKDIKAALGKCYGMWNQSQKKSTQPSEKKEW